MWELTIISKSLVYNKFLEATLFTAAQHYKNDLYLELITQQKTLCNLSRLKVSIIYGAATTSMQINVYYTHPNNACIHLSIRLILVIVSFYKMQL